MSCLLCDSTGGELVWECSLARVILADEPDYPGFCRVILNRHAREMTDLSTEDQMQLMKLVFAAEQVMRDILQPDKINLASLGNVVPHVHWHIIPRYREDRHFPAPVWAAAQREVQPRHADRLPAFRAALQTRLAEVLTHGN